MESDMLNLLGKEVRIKVRIKDQYKEVTGIVVKETTDTIEIVDNETNTIVSFDITETWGLLLTDGDELTIELL